MKNSRRKKIMGKGQENLLYQNIGTRNESYE